MCEVNILTASVLNMSCSAGCFKTHSHCQCIIKFIGIMPQSMIHDSWGRHIAVALVLLETVEHCRQFISRKKRNATRMQSLAQMPSFGCLREAQIHLLAFININIMFQTWSF